MAQFRRALRIRDLTLTITRSNQGIDISVTGWFGTQTIQTTPAQAEALLKALAEALLETDE